MLATNLLARFDSQVDLWMPAVMGGSALFCLVMVPVALKRGGLSAIISGASLSIAAIGLAAGTLLVLNLSYGVGEDLRVYSGFFDGRGEHLLWTRSITGAHPSSNPRGAPASSLDRLEISWQTPDGSGAVLVSPEDKEGFLDELVKRGAPCEREGLVLRCD